MTSKEPNLKCLQRSVRKFCINNINDKEINILEPEKNARISKTVICTPLRPNKD